MALLKETAEKETVLLEHIAVERDEESAETNEVELMAASEATAEAVLSLLRKGTQMRSLVKQRRLI